MIVRPAQPAIEAPSEASSDAEAPRQSGDLIADVVAPAAGREGAPKPPNLARRHGPAARKRWLRESRR